MKIDRLCDKLNYNLYIILYYFRFWGFKMGKRIALWDNLKLFLIFLVVLGHLSFDYFDSSQMFRTISMVIYTFHMPAFVFISGLFCKRSVNSDSPPIKRFFSFMMLG